MQGLHGFQKSMERPLDPMQHTTPCSGAEGQWRTSRRKTYSRYLDHGTIFPELYIMGVGRRSNTCNSQSWQRLHQVFNFLINQGEKDQVSGADKVIHRRNSKSQQPWKKKTYPHSTYDWKRNNRTGVGDIVLACNPSTWEVWDRKVATRSSQSAWPMWCVGSRQLSRIGIHLEVSL